MQIWEVYFFLSCLLENNNSGFNLKIQKHFSKILEDKTL